MYNKLLKLKKELRLAKKTNSFLNLRFNKKTPLNKVNKQKNNEIINTSIENQKNDLSNDLKYSEQEQIEEAEQSMYKQKGKKKKLLNAIFFILNIVVVCGILYYQITHEKISSFSELKGLKFYYIPVLLLIFVAIMTIDAYRTNLFLKKTGSRSRPYLCYKMCAIGRYYDNITPLSSGGEPSQIFYMNHRGLNASESISVPMGRYVVSQIAWMITALFGVVYIICTSVMDVSVILVIGLLGFAVNITLLSICLILSMSKKVGNKIVVKILKFLQKIHFVKNYEKQYERVMKVVVNYQNTMTTYAKNKFFFIYNLFLSILVFVFMYSMPFVIYLMLGGTNYSFNVWIDMLVFSVIIDLASSIIPIPGGSGMSEISFTVIFANIFPNGTVFWALLFWRFMTYYIYIIQGLCIVIYDYFIGNKKFKWLQKKWELEAESMLFEEEQIKKYKLKNKNKKIFK